MPISHQSLGSDECSERRRWQREGKHRQGNALALMKEFTFVSPGNPAVSKSVTLTDSDRRPSFIVKVLLTSCTSWVQEVAAKLVAQ